MSFDTRQNELLKVDEVAAVLKVDVWTVRNYLKTKRLKGFKVGLHGHWRVRRSDLDQFIKTGESSSDNGANSS